MELITKLKLLKKNMFVKLDKNEESFHFLVQANNTSEWMWKTYFKYVMAGFSISSILVCAGSTTICYVTKGDFDPEHVYHVLKLM